MKTAYATIKGFEVMRMFKKGQFTPWIDAIGGGTEAAFVNRLFGVYALRQRQDQVITRAQPLFVTEPPGGSCRLS